jgi:hypothetical protein
MLRATIWLSVLAWAASEVLRRAPADRRDGARLLFTAGAVLLVVHAILAFQLTHGWSHGAALAETARRTELMTGVASGAGLYLNYAFIAVWGIEAAWWWMAPAGYRHRARVIDRSMFAFFLFMIVNGAVVFAAGRMRVAGAAAVAAALIARVAPAHSRAERCAA